MFYRRYSLGHHGSDALKGSLALILQNGVAEEHKRQHRIAEKHNGAEHKRLEEVGAAEHNR